MSKERLLLCVRTDKPVLLRLAFETPGVAADLVNHDIRSRGNGAKQFLHPREHPIDIRRFLGLGTGALGDLDVEIRLHVHMAYSADLMVAYQRGEYAAVVVLEEQGRAATGTVLERHQLVWIGPAEFQWDKSQPLPIATFDRPCGFHKATTDALDRARISWRLVYTTTSVVGLIAAVRAGIAITARTPHAVHPGTALVQDALALPDLPRYGLLLVRSKTMPAGDRFENLLRGSSLLAG